MAGYRTHEAKITPVPLMPMRVPTPCVGLCSTTYGDSVCRGCKRFAHEIIDWNRYSESEKASVVARLDQLIGDVVSRYLLILNPEDVRSALISAGLRYRADQSPAWWAFDLFRQTKGRIGQLGRCGLQLLPEVKSLEPWAVWDAMNAEFLAISEGHYERYFRQPLSFD